MKGTRKFDKNAPGYEALRVTVFQVDGKHKPGVPTRDWVWYSGFAVILIQVAISAVPVATYSDWAPIMITIAGTILSLLQGALFQWREEKWACPTGGGWTASFTQGNGSRHVIVVLGNVHGLDLEILAGNTWKPRSSALTRLFLFVMAIVWLILLVSVAGLSTDSWC